MIDFLKFFLDSPLHVVGASMGIIMIIFGAITAPHWIVLTIWGLAVIGIFGSRYTEYQRKDK